MATKDCNAQENKSCIFSKVVIKVDTSLIYKQSRLTLYLKSDSVVMFNQTINTYLVDMEFRPFIFIDSFLLKNNHFVCCLDSSIIDISLNDYVCENSVISILIRLQDNRIGEKSTITCSKINDVCSDRLKVYYLDSQKIRKYVHIVSRKMVEYRYSGKKIDIKKAMKLKWFDLYDFKN